MVICYVASILSQPIVEILKTLHRQGGFTLPDVVQNGDDHKIDSHEEVRHREICQKTGLNRMIITSDQAPCYHGQVTEHSKDTEQPNASSGAWGLDHSLTVRYSISFSFRIFTRYVVMVLMDVATQRGSVDFSAIKQQVNLFDKRDL